MSWYIEALKKYAVFSGRARRKEYWLFGLFSGLIALVLVVVALVAQSSALFALVGVYYLGTLLPSLGVSVRRLHDTGHSGWWLFFYLVPIAGPITLLVFNCTDSAPGPNAYGPNPKEAAAIPAHV
ncbi:DUF805 domain-containing protein [Streptomyces xylophagus]|uniref:DUF805 domain-containing protein n=1 Tax=Streptomyces xylophagus TaxID=285514 RepID=UPI0005B868BD|nr:DUF805 domain-containing protein [Streptomyces xylophagus]